jgi:hypothetical protein
MKYAMLKSAIAPLLCLCSTVLEAQLLTIHVDAQTNRVTYKRDGQTIAKPHVKKGETILVYVEHFNTYLYTAEISESHQDLVPGEGVQLMQGIKGFGFGDLFQSFSNYDIEPEYQQSRNFEKYAVSANAYTEEMLDFANDANHVKKEAWYLMQSLMQIEAELREVEQEILQYHRRDKLRQFSVEEVEKIRLNPNIPAQKIKEHATAILSQALNFEGLLSPTLKDVFDKNDDIKLIGQLKSKQTSQLNKYQLGINQLGHLVGVLTAEDEDKTALESAIKMQIGGSKSVVADAKIVENQLDSLLQIAQNADVKTLMQIWYAYEAIASNSFSTTYQSTATGDVILFDIGFKKKVDVEAIATPEIVKLAPIKIAVHGAMKINTSLGLNFGKFANSQFSYFVNDTVIAAQEEDNYLPIIASYLHFYSQGRGNVSFGGSLGLGFPIGEELGLSAAQLFVGPSLFFGQSERFVLNVGLMAGKSKQLARGLQIGAAFEGATEDIPLHHRYQLGYVVGLSFNLKK